MNLSSAGRGAGEGAAATDGTGLLQEHSDMADEREAMWRWEQAFSFLGRVDVSSNQLLFASWCWSFINADSHLPPPNQNSSNMVNDLKDSGQLEI